ncbi:MAG: hypothetical protein R3D25_07460 [Geminicoccaceae bacterium]
MSVASSGTSTSSAFFDDRRDRIPDYIAGYPVLGTIDDLLVFARQHRIDQIVVALPWGAEERLLGWLKKLKSSLPTSASARTSSASICRHQACRISVACRCSTSSRSRSPAGTAS